MKRKMIERAVLSVLGLLTATGMAVLLFILGTVLWKGGPAISGEFLFEASSDFGNRGGIFYQTLGTLLLMAGAVAVSLPVALGTALFQTEYMKSDKIKKAFRNLIYSLNAVPTILFGLVGYLFFGVFLQAGVSWLTGTLVLAVMILPTLQVSIQEAVESIPEKYREAGMSLGLGPWAQARSVVLPQSVHGIITGALLGLARAGGETAAIMFTATTFSGISLPQSWADPVPTLQTHIFVLAQDAVNPVALNNAWGASLVLLTLVFLLIFASLVLRGRMQMEAER
ncbi:hypothetical protein UR09_00235 [Candidatus Nitromaritima sp. SCGC AAA799-A02]|nr:hypothetical protein UZ36_00230 [Candidatus Nitromaritima sp. SCGC AAA799-C22]KMP12748.1 hypothetical protein UR09_00235 [Candidatus Nitromaritima sp. SCGC AAA799-A02]